MKSYAATAKQLRTSLLLFVGKPYCLLIILFSSLAMHQTARAVSIDITVGELTSVATRLKEVVYVNDPRRPSTTFQLSLNKSQSSFDDGRYDVYYGVVLPNKTILSWQQSTGENPFKFDAVLGLVPLSRNASFDPVDKPQEVRSASTAAYHIFAPGDPLGEYQIFCIVVRPSKDPSDLRNWAGFASKILTVE